jgi:hypothetical protein
MAVDDLGANWVFALPGGEREKAYGRLKRLSLLNAMRSGFAEEMAHQIADYDDVRTRGLVGTLTAAADLPDLPRRFSLSRS